MGTTCYKSKKISLNKVQEASTIPEKKDHLNQNNEELKEQQIAKLNTSIPPGNNSILENIITQTNVEIQTFIPNIQPTRLKAHSVKVFH